MTISYFYSLRSIIRRGSCVITNQRLNHCTGEKWLNLIDRQAPRVLALQHSLYANAYQDKLPIKRNHLPNTYMPIVNPPTNLESLRDKQKSMQLKKSKKGKERDTKKDDSDKEDEDDDDDDDDGDVDDDDLVPVDYQDVDIETGSMRLDTVMKSAMPMPRKKIEEIHAEDKIRVNGQRVTKRSVDVIEGDIIDAIHGRNRENSKLLDVRRVKIVSVPEYRTAKDRVKFKIRRWSNLTIENYSIHPFESMILREEEEVRKR